MSSIPGNQLNMLNRNHRAGFAGAFVDREAETRGMDFIDRERAKVRLCSDYCDHQSSDYRDHSAMPSNRHTM